MSEYKRIPITDAKTGEVRYSVPAPRKEQRKSVANEHPTLSAEDQVAGDKPGVPAHALQEPASPNQGAERAGDNNKYAKFKQKAEITTLEQLIAHAYALKGRKVALKSKAERQIAKDPRLSEESRQRLRALVPKDITFAVPRQLLLVARRVTGHPKLRGAIVDFVRDTLLNHPIFGSEPIEAAIRNLDGAGAPSDILKQIASRKMDDLPTEFKDSIKPPDFEQLRLNAAYCMAIWLAETKSLSVAKVTDVLFTSLWSPKALALVSDDSKLDAISSIREMAGVGLACDEYQRRALESQRVGESAVEAAKTVSAKAGVLEAELNGLRLKVLDLEEAKKREQEAHDADCESMRVARETESAYLRNALEVQRTRFLRRLMSDVRLLEEGLHALRRPEPKVSVMVDYAERITDALRQEIKSLRGE